MNCRHCGEGLEHTFVDLGFAPPSNAYLKAEDLGKPETHYPLRAKVCPRCWLVQAESYSSAEDLFSHDYAYFSSTSSSWLAHAARYCTAIRERLQLNPQSFVVEIAANDGYLLRNFVSARIPCLGFEPTASTAAVAEGLGIPIRREFFGHAAGKGMAAAGQCADLIIGNNVYAHVPDINDFTAGLKAALKPRGVITLEFPHLLRLIEQTQFDTVYHEHFSYLSLYTVDLIFRRHGLRVWDVEELPTHGGSIRVFGCHQDDERAVSPAVQAVLGSESAAGLRDLRCYLDFQPRVDRLKDRFVAFLIAQKEAGRKVVAYGAAAKGNTLLNYAGIRPDLLPFVCDAAPAKQGKVMPGSHLPIRPPSDLAQARPDFVLILPWNIAPEVTTQHAYVRDWGGQFVVAVPEIRIL